MSIKVTGQKASYTRHSAEYKQEALKLAAHLGMLIIVQILPVRFKKQRPDLPVEVFILLFFKEI